MLLALAFLYTLLLTAVLSHGRIFWEDEMLGWMLLRDPSWHHMLFAYNHGADGGGFSFYLLGRAWLSLFGPSELAFRLFSSTCFGLALVVTWLALRRFYSRGIVALALLNTWFFSPPFVAHMAEGRFYGLLVFAVALTTWLTLTLATLTPPTPRRFYLAAFAANGLLVTTHLLGIMFSAFLLAALLASDLLTRRIRPLLYLCTLASWLLLLPERANIRATAAVGKPHFWTRAPTARELLDVYTGSCKEITLVLLVLLVAAAFLLWQKQSRLTSLRSGLQQRRPVYLVLAAFFLIPVCLLGEGLAGGTWLLNDRYLLPLTVAVAYFTAELLCLVYSALPPFALPLQAAVFTVFAACLLFWDFHHLRDFSPSPRDYTAVLTARLPHDLPVVCEDAFCFTELIGRQHDSGVHYVFLLDWQQSLLPSAPRVEVTQYHLMNTWRAVGYFSGSIQPIGQFLAHHREFLVINTALAAPNGLPPYIGNPLTERFAHDSRYQVRPFTTLDYGKFRDTVSLVCRLPCQNPQ